MAMIQTGLDLLKVEKDIQRRSKDPLALFATTHLSIRTLTMLPLKSFNQFLAMPKKSSLATTRL